MADTEEPHRLTFIRYKLYCVVKNQYMVSVEWRFEYSIPLFDDGAY